jgi:hypothetical protein
LDDLLVQSFLKFARFKHLEQGEVIYKKGDKVKDYIIVCSGSLKTKEEAKFKKQNVWPSHIDRGESFPYKWQQTTA